MKASLSTIVAVVLVATPALAETKDNPSPDARPAIQVDPAMQEVLDKINAASAYEVPDLGLRLDENYAYTSKEVSP